MNISNKITTKSVLGYILLPRIIPRIKELLRGGFAQIALFMAQVYAMVRLLPDNHPYLQSQNIGKFGIRHVIAQAANRLILKKENIDQIFIFFILLAGLILLVLQFVAVIYSFIFQPALAQSIFVTPNPAEDIALNMLDRVFGIPQLACSGGQCTEYHDEALGGGPTPFHAGLHNMYQFYSLGILVVGVLVFLYYLIVVIGETAMTGSPFGQRFQNIWVPIRLVVAVGLLVPINYGLNSAQYITLFAAKWGSGLATNGWNQFNETITEKVPDNANPTGESETLLANPKSPSVAPMIHFMSLAHACAYAEWQLYEHDEGDTVSSVEDYGIQAYMVKSSFETGGGDNYKELTSGYSYNDALEFFDNGDIFIRFGVRDEEKYKEEKGAVKPTCGEIRVHTSSAAPEDQGKGPSAIQQKYFEMIRKLWFEEQAIRNLARRHIAIQTNKPVEKPCTIGNTEQGFEMSSPACEEQIPSSKVGSLIIQNYQGQLKAIIESAWDTYSDHISIYAYSEELEKRGWGGAGMWYNQIARINGSFIGAALNIPTVAPNGLPTIMQEVLNENEAQNNSFTSMEMYCPNYENGKAGTKFTGKEDEIARQLCNFNAYWTTDPANVGGNNDDSNANPMLDAINLIFGTQGLIDLRGDNRDIHPMAQLTALGKGLVDSAVANIGASTVFAFGGGALGQLQYQKTAVALQLGSEMMSAIAFFGLIAGVIMFYILPFLPFIYFFFAVGIWIKTIFEAMVGVPLWALSHLRMDGEGLPGESASNGYFLIFEIFIRPILIVFGLIGAMVIFTMQVRVLNFLWDLAVNNLTGFRGENNLEFAGQNFNMGPIDNFFYTIVYAMVLYMLATTSFKLIDRVPSSILRWMGTGATAFGDISQENIENITQYAAFSGITIGEKATGAISKASGGLGGSVGNLGRQFGLGVGGGTPKIPPGAG